MSKFLYILDGKYAIPKSGNFLAELSDVDFSYYYRTDLLPSEKDEDLDDLVWERNNPPAVMSILDEFKDSLPNYYDRKLSMINLEYNEQKVLFTTYYMSYVLFIMDNEHNHYLVNNNMELIPFTFDKENFEKFNNDSYRSFDQKLEEYKDKLFSFDIKEYFEDEAHSDYVLKYNSTKGNKKINLTGHVISMIENSSLKNKMKDMANIFIIFNNHSSYSWKLTKAVIGYLSINFDKPMTSIYSRNISSEQIIVIPLNIENTIKQLVYLNKGWHLYNYLDQFKFKLDISIKENINIANTYLNTLKDFLKYIRPTGIEDSYINRFIKIIMIYNNNETLNQFKKDDLDASIMMSDPTIRQIFFEKNFYTEQMIKPILLDFYKVMLKSNYNSIANKFIRIYYKENIEKKHALVLLTQAVCEYFYRRKMARGIDAHKKYKLTANNIAKIVMQI